jgi:hypothetical protein
MRSYERRMRAFNFGLICGRAERPDDPDGVVIHCLDGLLKGASDLLSNISITALFGEQNMSWRARARRLREINETL